MQGHTHSQVDGVPLPHAAQDACAQQVDEPGHYLWVAQLDQGQQSRWDLGQFCIPVISTITNQQFISY